MSTDVTCSLNHDVPRSMTFKWCCKTWVAIQTVGTARFGDETSGVLALLIHTIPKFLALIRQPVASQCVMVAPPSNLVSVLWPRRRQSFVKFIWKFNSSLQTTSYKTYCRADSLILGNVTPSVIEWAQTQKRPCIVSFLWYPHKVSGLQLFISQESHLSPPNTTYNQIDHTPRGGRNNK